MYSDKMTQAVNKAQNYITACNQTNNIALTATEHINKFCGYVNDLDPSSINFHRDSVLNNLIIKHYWTKFAEYYPAIESILNQINSDKKIIENTLYTFGNMLIEYNIVFDEFEKSDDTSSEHTQQLIVAKNMKLILDNTKTEYTALNKKIELVLNIAKQVFDTAVLIAESNYEINIRNNSNVSGIADVDIYENRYTELRHILS